MYIDSFSAETPVEYSRHALERYAERVRPGLPLSSIESELRSVVTCGGRIVVVPPLWAPWDSKSSAYLVVGDDVVLPLRSSSPVGYVAVTCLTRNGFSRSVRGVRK